MVNPGMTASSKRHEKIFIVDDKAPETSHEKISSVISSGTHAPENGEVEAGEKFLQSLFNVKTGRDGPSTLTEKGIDLFANHRPDRPELWKESPQQLVRRKELRERCSAEELNPLLDLSRMVYDDKHKVVMCEVPKTGCTTMKGVLLYLQRNVDKANIDKLPESRFHLQNMGTLNR
ncbi:uncharacterized protein LOC143448910 [Clavelina lepadiformis]|uniref:uncharacterized protein LOC143448910 n=1 Tax=Clavelina lepadiformis TaxID=159417 RepID=UPI004041B841